MSKTKSQLEAELKELKARMRTLTQQQAEAAAAAPAVVEEAPAEAPAEAHGGLTADFDELIEVLKHEIEGVPVMTGIAVFGLGVLTGRLLAH